VPFRLAHFSDIHVTRSPFSESLRSVLGKIGAGAVNYYVGGRRHHFRAVDARIEALLEDVDAQNIDHAICTGDITSFSHVAEFERCAELFGPRLEQPERYTVIPGNHDRYTERATTEKRFERLFAGLCGGDAQFPFSKKIGPGVRVFGLDVTRPTGPFDSSGRAGEAQLERLGELLRDPEGRDDVRILALHYGLLRSRGQRDRRRHGIRDDLELIELVRDPSSQLDLVVHGHMHGAYHIDIEGVAVMCAGSATDLHRECGYNLYEIDTETRSLRAWRRVWNQATQRYEEGKTWSVGSGSLATGT
jgi:3',5'-cyclic AMP phosphodiesterase CpdA